MNDCCISESKVAYPKKRICPNCGIESTEVSARTIAHHIKQSWKWSDDERHFYFCAHSDCDIVYFSDADSVIPKSQLRTLVGVKEAASDTLVCYCFGVSKAEAKSDPGIRDFVVNQTKLGLCSCDTSNPSGRCCLINFKWVFVEEYG